MFDRSRMFRAVERCINKGTMIVGDFDRPVLTYDDGGSYNDVTPAHADHLGTTDQPKSFWLDGFAITQHPVQGKSESGSMEQGVGGVVQHHPEVGEIAQVIQDIGQTVLVIPGAGDPHMALRPCLRSWVLFEIANTPPRKLTVELGAAHSDLELHKLYRKSINQLSVEQATATFPKDKEMVDTLLLQKFGSYQYVNTMLTYVLMDVFRLYYEEVYCHVDPGVIQVYQQVDTLTIQACGPLSLLLDAHNTRNETICMQ